MSKVVTIPKDRNPFVVIVNGVKHSYPAGVSTEVPDEVADVIEKYVGAKPKPDPNAGINFGGVQSDWNQTDSSAADFIKNKTHGYESAVFAPEQTFTPNAEGAPLEYILSPEINSEVTVVFDGESYVYTAGDFFDDGVAVGNIDILMGTAEESGGPCLVAFMPEQNMCMVMTIDQTTSHTIKVTGKNLYKIPNIYYDQCAYFYVDGDGGADAIIHNHFALQSPVTLEELRDAVNNSKIVLYENSSSDFAKQYGTYYPFYVECYTGQNWGTVYVYKKDGSVGQYHTAEYTP